MTAPTITLTDAARLARIAELEDLIAECWAALADREAGHDVDCHLDLDALDDERRALITDAEAEAEKANAEAQLDALMEQYWDAEVDPMSAGTVHCDDNAPTGPRFQVGQLVRATYPDGARHSGTYIGRVAVIHDHQDGTGILYELWQPTEDRPHHVYAADQLEAVDLPDPAPGQVWVHSSGARLEVVTVLPGGLTARCRNLTDGGRPVRGANILHGYCELETTR